MKILVASYIQTIFLFLVLGMLVFVVSLHRNITDMEPLIY